MDRRLLRKISVLSKPAQILISGWRSIAISRFPFPSCSKAYTDVDPNVKPEAEHSVYRSISFNKISHGGGFRYYIKRKFDNWIASPRILPDWYPLKAG